MSTSYNIEGVVRNAFYMPNQRCENVNTFFDKEQGVNSEVFQYDVDESGELVIIRVDNR